MTRPEPPPSTSATSSTPATDGPPRPERRPRGATVRGLRTRERLLDAAERLWGERGVDGVSLREIRLAAGERNNSALQFHFGGRDGLLLALAQRHLPRVTRIQEQLYARTAAEGRHTDVAALVEVLVRPGAEYLRRGPSERAWIKVSAEQATRPERTDQDFVDHAPAVALHVGTTVYEQLSGRMDPTIAVERLVSVMAACGHLCADRARIEDALAGSGSRPARSVLPFDTWLANLLDMAVGALLAPARPRPEGSR